MPESMQSKDNQDQNLPSYDEATAALNDTYVFEATPLDPAVELLLAQYSQPISDSIGVEAVAYDQQPATIEQPEVAQEIAELIAPAEQNTGEEAAAQEAAAQEAAAQEAAAQEVAAQEAAAKEAAAKEAAAKEAAAQEAAAQEAAAQEAAAKEAAAQEAAAQEAAAQEAAAQEAAAQEAAAKEAAAQEAAAKEAAAKEAAAKEAAAKEAAAKEAAAQEAAAQEAAAQEAAAQEAAAQEAAAQEAAAQEAAAQEAAALEVATQDVATQDVATQDVATQDVATQDVATQDVATQDVATQDVATQDVATQDVATQDVATQDVATQDVATQDVATQDVATQEVAAKEVAAQATPAATAKSDPQPAAEPAKPAKPADPLFSELELSQEVQQAVAKSGYDKPTPVQAQIIPHMLQRRDLLAQSQTGTGKTAAFALPILSQIDLRAPTPQVLVLAPTRELAIQVAKSFSTYGAFIPGFGVCAIYGGQDYEPQLRQLRRGVQVVVGTPGRVIDHINRGTLKLDGIRCLVLDEADEMLNMGFLEDVEFVLKHAPDERQIALFSATMPTPIRMIADRYLNDPAKITIKKRTMTAESIRQRAVFVAQRDKVDALTRILEVEETDGVIVFTKTRDATITVAEELTRQGLAASPINGDMPQKVRERTIEQLKSGQLDILVATDVAARGLDVQRISHVFNFDLPHDSESYVHRIGRTGRAGRSGEAIIFLSGNQRGKLRMIERATKQQIEVIDLPSTADINAARVKRFKDQITAMTADHDLTMFKDLLTEYAEETNKSMDQIAAALAQLAQQGRPFLVKDRPRKERAPRGEERGRGRRDRFDDDSFDRSERPRRNGKPGRQLGAPEPGMTRYRIQVGWQDGVKPGNIVGAVANEAGIAGDCIGPIQINDRFSTIDLPEGMPSDIYHTLSNTWVSGKQLRLRLDSDGDFEGGGGPRKDFGKGKFKGKRNGQGFSGGGKPGFSKSHSGKPFAGGKSKKRKAKA
ncbi:ATP-dependent RNA helicase DeaD [Rosistilla oblonga]|uniref:ATP-dependent RNA helicase DeaD n=2 Tax=Rosistilla oblonga TaxID=2527990 RepID=A0A518IYV4_9BACT|nr:ATP-dependent RNA helicase DeaD [Rosistilla oblonga]